MVRNDGSVNTQMHSTNSLLLQRNVPQITNEQRVRLNQEDGVFDPQQLQQAVDGLNKTIGVFDRSLEFSIHEDTNRIMVRVIEYSNSEEKIIREIPPEKILDMVAEFMSMIGVLIDEKV